MTEHGRLRVHVGGADHRTLEAGRRSARLEVVAGYERALSRLHSDDVAAHAWFAARLADARVLAQLPAAEPVLHEPAQRFARHQLA